MSSIIYSSNLCETVVKKIAKNVIFTKYSLKIPSLKCWNKKVRVTRDFGCGKSWGVTLALLLRSLTQGVLQTLSFSRWWENVLLANWRDLATDNMEGTGSYQMSLTLPFSHPIFVTSQCRVSSHSYPWKQQKSALITRSIGNPYFLRLHCFACCKIL